MTSACGTLLAFALLGPPPDATLPPDATAVARHPGAVPRAACFPLGELPGEARGRSAGLLLAALDSEALFTLVGDLKPVSEGFWNDFFAVDPADPAELAAVRAALTAWRCGDHYEAGVLPFDALRDGERYAAAWVAARPALRRTLADRADFFGGLGLTPESTAEAVLLRVEGAGRPADRWRGFGLAFGYPDRAVDFFVAAGVHQRETGEFVGRDFRHYPTHAREAGGFVYAVPRLDPESDAERRLRRAAAAVLAAYRTRRKRYVTDDDPARVAELVRDWFEDGTGWCHPDHALQKATAEAGR